MTSQYDLGTAVWNKLIGQSAMFNILYIDRVSSLSTDRETYS